MLAEMKKTLKAIPSSAPGLKWGAAVAGGGALHSRLRVQRCKSAFIRCPLPRAIGSTWIQKKRFRNQNSEKTRGLPSWTSPPPRPSLVITSFIDKAIGIRRKALPSFTAEASLKRPRPAPSFRLGDGFFWPCELGPRPRVPVARGNLLQIASPPAGSDLVYIQS